MGADRTVRFPAAQVLRHAGTVDQVSGAMSSAGSAVHEVTMDQHAYGVLCQFLPVLLTPVFGLALDAVRGSADSLRGTATRLRTAAAGTASTDAGSETRLAAVSGRHRPIRDLPL